MRLICFSNTYYFLIENNAAKNIFSSFLFKIALVNLINNFTKNSFSSLAIFINENIVYNLARNISSNTEI